MKLAQAFRMAFSTLMAKKMRSFLTMLGTIIGVTAVISLVSVTAAQNKANRDLWMDMSKNLINVYCYSWEMDMTEISRQISDFINQDLQDLTIGMTPILSDWEKKVKWGSKDMTVQRFYYGSEQFTTCMSFPIVKGRDLSYMDIEHATNVVILGSYVAEMIFNYQDPIGQTVYISGVPFTVIGVFQKIDTYEYNEDQIQWTQDNMALVPYTAARSLNPSLLRQSPEFYIKAIDAFATRDVVELINDFLANLIGEKGYYNAYTSTDYIEEIEEAESQQTMTMGIIAAISLLVGGIGIMNIMLVTVTERTREIGIRKAIGAPRRSIVMQFLIEASVLSSIGGVLGVIIGFAVTLYWGKIQYNVIASPDLLITGIAFGVSVLMGIVFGIYPAAKAARLQPVDALRTD